MVVGLNDQWEIFLVSWKFGHSPCDIYISNDYRLIIPDYNNLTLTLFNPNKIL